MSFIKVIETNPHNFGQLGNNKMKGKYKNILSILKNQPRQILIYKIYLTELTRTFCIICEEKNFAKEKTAQNYLDEASSNTLKTFCKSGIRF